MPEGVSNGGKSNHRRHVQMSDLESLKCSVFNGSVMLDGWNNVLGSTWIQNKWFGCSFIAKTTP